MTARHVFHRAHDVVVAAQRFVAPDGVVAPIPAAANEHGAFVGFVTYE